MHNLTDRQFRWNHRVVICHRMHTRQLLCDNRALCCYWYLCGWYLLSDGGVCVHELFDRHLPREHRDHIMFFLYCWKLLRNDWDVCGDGMSRRELL